MAAFWEVTFDRRVEFEKDPATRTDGDVGAGVWHGGAVSEQRPRRARTCVRSIKGTTVAGAAWVTEPAGNEVGGAGRGPDGLENRDQETEAGLCSEGRDEPWGERAWMYLWNEQSSVSASMALKETMDGSQGWALRSP